MEVEEKIEDNRKKNIYGIVKIITMILVVLLISVLGLYLSSKVLNKNSEEVIESENVTNQSNYNIQLGMEGIDFGVLDKAF